MTAAPKTYLIPEEYLARERLAEIKSEYYDGEVFAMAGGSEEHSLIATNVIIELGLQLREQPYKVYNSDMRVQVTEEGPYTYPDATVVCGEANFADAEVDTLLNPTVIVEVLPPNPSPGPSPARRGESASLFLMREGGWWVRFEQYQRMLSLQEYVMIAVDRPRVQRYARQGEWQWLLTVAGGLDGVLALPSITCELTLREVYRKVTFPEDAGRRR
jgi:Uma2 family endonuclease